MNWLTGTGYQTLPLAVGVTKSHPGVRSDADEPDRQERLARTELFGPETVALLSDPGKGRRGGWVRHVGRRQLGVANLVRQL